MTRQHIVVLTAIALSGSVLLTGCGKTEQPAPPAPPQAQPSPAPTSLPTPPAVPPTSSQVAPSAPVQEDGLLSATKADIEKAYALAKESKYQEALALLQQRAVAVQANPEAKQLIDTATVKIKQMMADAATKAATEKVGDSATKAIGGLLSK